MGHWSFAPQISVTWSLQSNAVDYKLLRRGSDDSSAVLGWLGNIDSFVDNPYIDANAGQPVVQPNVNYTYTLVAAFGSKDVNYNPVGGYYTDYSRTETIGPVLGIESNPIEANSNSVGAEVFDGIPSTYFGTSVANGNWVGLDLGSAKSITQISFAPRLGYANRMVGGVFQVSNTSDFSSGVVSACTITSLPVQGSLTNISIGNLTGKYRYIRYLSPNGSYGNVAEMTFYG